MELELYLNQVFFIVGRKRGAGFDEGSVEDRASTAVAYRALDVRARSGEPRTCLTTMDESVRRIVWSTLAVAAMLVLTRPTDRRNRTPAVLSGLF